MLVLNNPLEPGAGFQHDTNKITILKADGDAVELPLMTKLEAADEILNLIKEGQSR